MHHQIKFNITEVGEHISNFFGSELREGGFEVGKFANPWPCMISRSSMELEDFKDLVDFGVTHKERSLLNQLGEYAADCPHVHT